MVRRALSGIMSGIDQQASLLDRLDDAKELHPTVETSSTTSG
jgi:hypothetical protein